MKPPKLLKKLGFVILAIFTIALSVFLPHPSNAYEAQYSNMIALGLIDSVKTTHELGLDYLQRTPPILVADLMDNIHRANRIVQNTDDIRVKIPLPSENNATISGGDVLSSTANHPQISPEPGRYRALAIVNQNTGQTHPIRSGRGRELNQMFTAEARGEGDIDQGIEVSKDLPRNTNVIIADASGLFAQQQQIYNVGLILYDTFNGDRYLVEDVNFNAFCRDALNAVLEDTWEAL